MRGDRHDSTPRKARSSTAGPPRGAERSRARRALPGSRGSPPLRGRISSCSRAGAYSPLRGFSRRRTSDRSSEPIRPSPSGQVFTIPDRPPGRFLGVRHQFLARAADRIGLYDEAALFSRALDLREEYRYDRRSTPRRDFGTNRRAHSPGVRRITTRATGSSGPRQACCPPRRTTSSSRSTTSTPRRPARSSAPGLEGASVGFQDPATPSTARTSSSSVGPRDLRCAHDQPLVGETRTERHHPRAVGCVATRFS